jgi:putative ABC transport system substrate-binding protein
MRLMPKARTFGLIYADMPQSRSYNRWLEDLLRHDPEFREIRIIYRPVPLVTGEKGDRAMAENSRRIIRELDPRVDAYIKPCDQMGTRRHFSEVVYATSKKPLIGLVKDDVMGSWGAVATIFPLHDSIGRQAARMIKELFEGRMVSDVMPEWPQKYGVAIDLRKARRFGVDVPVELLQMAGENIIR